MCWPQLTHNANQVQIAFAMFVALLEERQHLWVNCYDDAAFLADHGFSVAHLLILS